jgi:hypothetical protein
MTIAIGSASGTGSTAAAFGAAKKPVADFATILENFKKAAAQTPAERAREAVLKKHDLSEADYQKLPAAKRDAIDKEVAEAVKKVTERKTGVALSDRPWGTLKIFG